MAQSTSGLGCSMSPFEPLRSPLHPSSFHFTPPHPSFSSSSSTASSSYSGSGSTHTHHLHNNYRQTSPPSPVSSLGTHLNDNRRSMTSLHSLPCQSPPSFPDSSMASFRSLSVDLGNSPPRSAMHTCSLCHESILLPDKCRDCGVDPLCASCLSAHERECVFREHIPVHHRTGARPRLPSSSTPSPSESRSSAPVGYSTINHRRNPTSTESFSTSHSQEGSMFSKSRGNAIAALEEAIAANRATLERFEARAAMANLQIHNFCRYLLEAVVQHKNELIANLEKVRTLKEGSLCERANQLQQALNRLLTLPPPSSSGCLFSIPDAHVILNFTLNSPHSHPIGSRSRALNAVPPLPRTFVSVEENLKTCEDDYVAFQTPVDTSVILHALTTAGRVVSSAFSVNTEASGNGLKHPRVGHTAVFEIRMLDHLGQLSDISCDIFTVNIENPDGSRSSGSVRNFNQGVNGTISASWMPTQEGTHIVHVLMRGKHIQGSPFMVQTYGRRDYTNIRNPVLILGGEGEEEGRFCRPWGIAVDKRGNIVVADRSNNRIQIFSSDGRFLRAFGRQGSGRGEFERPAGVACDCLGRIVVADKDNHRIQVFSAADTSFLLMFGERGSRVGQFHYPWDVDCAPDSGAIVVSDTRNHRIQLFTPVGEFIQKFGFDGSCLSGTWKHFDSPRGVCFYKTSSALLPFSQMDGRKIKINENPTALHDNLMLRRRQCFSSTDQSAVGSLPSLASNGSGGASSSNTSPNNAIWTTHRVVVTDFNNHTLIVIDPDFISARSLGGSGNGEGQFMRPQGVAVDEEGRIIVADSRNNRIQVFDTYGAFHTQWGTFGTQPGEMDRPSGICVSPNGQVLVLDFGNSRVQGF